LLVRNAKLHALKYFLMHFIRLAVLPALATTLFGQHLTWPTYLNPAALYAGSGPTSLSVFNQDYPGALTALWNGSPRPTSRNPSGAYAISLTPADLALPQLAHITMLNSSGQVVDNINCAVGFNLQPTGVAYDATRSRLYVATPPKPGDSRFPANAVVAIDTTTLGIVATLQLTAPLGDVALSGDASALYVAIEGTSQVQRIDPASFATGASFPFRAGPPASSTFVPSDYLAVMPGSPGTVALEFAPQDEMGPPQIVIYDNGVRRPNALTCCSGNGFLFSPDGKYLFPGSAIRYSIDQTGIPAQTPLTAPGTPAAISGTALYTLSGTVVDYQTMQPTGSFGIQGPIAVDAGEQRALMLYTPPLVDDEGDHGPVELAAFTLPSLEALGAQALGVKSISALNASEQLIRFGSDGVIVPSTNGLLIFHTPLAGPAPVIAANAVVNAATEIAEAIAPGEIVTIYGANLGPASAQSAASQDGAFASSLANVQVWFGALPGIPLVAYQGQINVVAPFGLQTGVPVNLQVWYYGIPSVQVSLPVVAAAPGLFTQDGSGKGPVCVINQDGTVNTPSRSGSVVTLYGTGGGVMPGARDGFIATNAGSLSSSVQVSIGGVNASVLYAGAAPGLVDGVFQLNVQVPPNIPSGASNIVVTIAGQSSPQGATLAIR
jgi:uncharacterized protein (TIGR03437 family)